MSQYQEKFHCCGIIGLIDYRDAKLPLPKSCFSQNHTVFLEGCLAKLKDFYNGGIEILMIAGWIFFGLQTLAYVGASFSSLAFKIEQRRTRNIIGTNSERERLLN
ncbi:uncharacterized protein Dana_GF19814 [Drosophila ananassae]|uniref:Tetraspanin n=1 Tax=Drosophila ananassae TaxID=7217 RepID=A0A0P8ZM66_DROAN|nr:protein late bloomer-like [Drosophila ananassae]KPU75866.1 uncharacterized protein Dana_GF19814 [Drosophila ananassae]